MKAAPTLVFMLLFIGAINCASINEEASASTSEPASTTEPPVNCYVTPDPDGFAILLPDPNSCDSYYVCADHTPVKMPCPKGLHFNPKLKVCDWPDRAGCEVQGTSDSENAV